MARVPNEKIEEIKNSVNIVDVVGTYIDIVKKGANN